MCEYMKCSIWSMLTIWVNLTFSWLRQAKATGRGISKSISHMKKFILQKINLFEELILKEKINLTQKINQMKD